MALLDRSGAHPHFRKLSVPRAAVSISPPSGGETSSPDGRATDWRLTLLGVVILSGLYVAWHLGRGWIPHDEGALAQSARRLLHGELPHRDFDELYTGGLTWLNAAAFKLLGETLFSMRVVLFAVFLAWIPAVFYIATRFVRPALAVSVTLLCVAWSLPNYPAPLPSWYNLFLAVFGLAALFRWLEDRRPRWLIAAGVAGGLSLLVKVIGLYYVAGVLLFFVFEAHALSRGDGLPPRGFSRLYASFATAALLLFCLALLMVVRHQLHAGELVQFVLPSALIACLLVHIEWTQPAGASGPRFRAFARLVAPFLLGVALPVVVFLIPFAQQHALGALFEGVFILPSRRFGVAVLPMLPLWSMLALVPAWFLLALVRRVPARMTRYSTLGLAALLTAVLVATRTNARLYESVWFAVRALLPVLVLIGVVRLGRARAVEPRALPAGVALLRSQTMLLLSASALLTLVQFPFSAPIYFCYVAPVVALLALALYAQTRPVAPAIATTVTLFLTAFAVLQVNTSTLYDMGAFYRAYPRTVPLGLPNGGLDVSVQDAQVYRIVARVLTQHARGEYTWASPDCPEIYFLTGLRNPTRTLFDFFDDQGGRTGRILSTLQQRHVTAVVLNRVPHFTRGIPDDLVAALEERYPFGANVGKFQVRWQ